MRKFIVLLIPCAVFARVFLISDMNFNSRSSGLRSSDFAERSQYSSNFVNPAFLADQSIMYFSSTYYNHFEDINSGSIALSYPDFIVKGSSTAFSIATINYGTFTDLETGSEYNPYDLMLTVSQGMTLNDVVTGVNRMLQFFNLGKLGSGVAFNNILIGSNLKYVYSSITTEYSSGAFITDAAVLYRFFNDRMAIGAGLFDVGIQTDEFYTSGEKIVPHLRTGLSYKLEKLPLKICSQYDYYMSGINLYAMGLELDAKKNLIVRAGYDFSGDEKEIGSNNKIEKFGGISLGATILFSAFGFDFSYIVNGELDPEYCATINIKAFELFK